MNAVGVGRIAGLSGLVKDFGKISLKVVPPFLLGFLLVGGAFYWFISSKPESKIDKEFFNREYSELAIISESLDRLRLDVKITGESLAYIKVHNKGVPENLWTAKQLSERNRLETRYWRLRSEYHELALEYNRRHEAVNYRFAYYKTLPEGAKEILPKYYVRLEG